MSSLPLPVLTDPALAGLDGVRHGFFTREGGVSGGLYASLNCGFGAEDAREAVAENRARIAASLGVAADRLVSNHQVHSADVVVVETPWLPTENPRADGLVTRQPGVALGVLAADCVPILFADPAARVIGAAHAGWKGARAGMAEATVDAMVRLGADASRIRAAIGPAIRPRSYEVGPEFPAHFPGADRFFQPAARAGHFLFDLPGYVRDRLVKRGLAAVGDLALDTASDERRFFSYRRATLRREPDYGRMLSAIVLA